MKCARCAHQWKIGPGDALADEEAPDDAVAAQPDQQWHADSEASEHVHDVAEAAQQEDSAPDVQTGYFPPEAPPFEETEDIAESWEAPQDEARQSTSSLSEPAATYDELAEEATFEDHQMIAALDEDLQRQGMQLSQKQAVDEASPEPLVHLDEPAAEEDVAQEAGDSWSSRFMGPGWRGEEQASHVEEDEDEDPETLIRESFRSALEKTEEEDTGGFDAALQEAEASPYGSIYDADWNRTDDEDGIRAQQGGDAALDQPSSNFEDDSDVRAIAETSHIGPDPEIEDFNDPGPYLGEGRGDQDKPSYLGRGVQRDEPNQGGAYVSTAQNYDPLDDEDYDEVDSAAIGRFGPINGRSQNFDELGRDGKLDNESAGYADPDDTQDYDRRYAERYDDDAKHDLEDDFDDTLVGIRHDDQLDNLDEPYDSKRQNSSGLAVAAGWVAFMSLMGGLVLGIVNFRQDVMTVRPGTVTMYRLLGYEVELGKVDFASVNYQWSKIDGRPALELSGQVVNITDDTVAVPPVLVSVRSSSGAAFRAEASVPADELGPRRSTPFTLDLVAPPEDVSRIELEFAPVR